MFRFVVFIFFLSSLNQNPSQNIRGLLPSLGQPNDITSQTAVFLTQVPPLWFGMSPGVCYELFNVNLMWELEENRLQQEKGGWKERETFSIFQKRSTVVSLPVNLKPIHSYIQKFLEQNQGGGTEGLVADRTSCELLWGEGVLLSTSCGRTRPRSCCCCCWWSALAWCTGSVTSSCCPWAVPGGVWDPLQSQSR